MSYKVTNTALDYSKRFLHRRAPKLQMEPVFAGRRLRIRTSMVISDELFEHNKSNLELYRSWGVLDWEKVGGEKTAVASPSVELPVLTPENATPAPPPLETEAPPAESLFSEDSAVSPPAETTPKETKPQPKSPFKGKKQ